MPVAAYAANAQGSPLEPFSYEPGPLKADEVEVKVTHCGICHSDLAMIDNEWGFSQYPLVPGHEVVGIVSAVGPEVTRVKVGQRVGIGWQCGSCGVCEFCQAAEENYCPKEEATIIGHHGGWAETVRTRQAFAIALPDAVDSADAGPLMCAGTTVFSPMLHYDVRPTFRAAVVGIGGLGHLAVQFLAKFGCEVTAISSTHSKDEEARTLGARHFLATRDTNELKQAAGSFDFILCTVTADIAWDDLIGTLRPRGTLCIVGIPHKPIPVPAFAIIPGEKRIGGGRTGSPADTAKMLDFAARHNVRPMINRFKMSDVNAAVEHLRSGKARYRVVLEA